MVGTELSLKTALVSLFVEEILELEGDEKGKHIQHVTRRLVSLEYWLLGVNEVFQYDDIIS